MAKRKISRSRGKSSSGMRRLKPGATARLYDPSVTLRDPRFIQRAILQALKAGDFEGVMGIYRAHLRVLNRSRTAKELNVSRQYIHRMLKEKSPVPSLRTFAAFMRVVEKEIGAPA